MTARVLEGRSFPGNYPLSARSLQARSPWKPAATVPSHTHTNRGGAELSVRVRRSPGNGELGVGGRSLEALTKQL